MAGPLHQLYRYRDIILYRTLAGLKSEARQNYLGYIWFFLEPVLITAILYFAFGHLFSRGGAAAVLLILIGMIMWQWFESSVTMAMYSIRSKIAILEHYQLPKFIFPVVNVAINTWKFLFVLLVVLTLTFVIATFGESVVAPGWTWLLLPVFLFLQLAIILGLGMILAVAASYMNDAVTVVSSVMRLMFFLSGVFFRLDQVPLHLQLYFLANPVATLIESYRIILLDGEVPPAEYFLYLFGLATLLLLVGFVFCRSQEGKILKGIVRG